MDHCGVRAVGAGPCGEHQPPPDAPAMRESPSQALLVDLRTLGEQFVRPLAPPCRAWAWRLWPFQGERLTGVRPPQVPADTTAAERAIRPLVVARQISGGTRSARGSSATRMALATRATRAHPWRASGLAPLAEFRRLPQSPFPPV